MIFKIIQKSIQGVQQVAEPAYPILDTRIFVFPTSVFPSVSPFDRLRLPPLDSETGWTGELWLKTNLLKYIFRIFEISDFFRFFNILDFLRYFLFFLRIFYIL